MKFNEEVYMTKTNDLEIRPIFELLEYEFFIPRYQRGYRWEQQQILELLDDILQYSKEEDDNFYCLQPVVVKEKPINNDVIKWELIDGQQRLTTIYLILSYLKDIKIYEGLIYSLEFETREKSTSFFNEGKFKEKNDTNIDYFHISEGYGYIKDWFKEHQGYEEKIKDAILDKNGVSIIWYVEKYESSSIDLFTRLNEGKILLTDSELIKALLLQADRYPQNEVKVVAQRLFEIASEWDQIEASLQDDKMWYFISNKKEKPSSRIEILFNLLATGWKGEQKKDDDKTKHYTYLVFNEMISDKRKDGFCIDQVNEIWKQVKELFTIFSEWYNDHELFHYIGYLIATDEKNKEHIIRDLLDKQKDITKTEFMKYLKQKIAKLVECKKKLSEINYGDNNNEIINILLLFNIQTLIEHKKENSRFPFHLYKRDKIKSIEHIIPQHPDKIEKDENRCAEWLTVHQKMLESEPNESGKKESILKEINYFNQNKFNTDKFIEIYNEIINIGNDMSNIDESQKHSLYNLALVDTETNSALNNSFFNIKREILKDKESKRYIPICTQRVFSKYYSNSPQDMIFWNEDDRNAYFEAIEKVYKAFVDSKGGSNGE